VFAEPPGELSGAEKAHPQVLRIQNEPSSVFGLLSRLPMYRNLTVTQIIDRGEYLEEHFDPKYLTVPQLFGILINHNVQCPTQCNKTNLITLFKTSITAHSSKLKWEYQQRKNTLASDVGIFDGTTGQPIGEKNEIQSNYTLTNTTKATTQLKHPLSNWEEHIEDIEMRDVEDA
jgi:hypothetical protein